MLRLNCPFCGLRDHHEFAYLEDASVQMPSFEAHLKKLGLRPFFFVKIRAVFMWNIGIISMGVG